VFGHSALLILERQSLRWLHFGRRKSGQWTLKALGRDLYRKHAVHEARLCALRGSAQVPPICTQKMVSSPVCFSGTGFGCIWNRDALHGHLPMHIGHAAKAVTSLMLVWLLICAQANGGADANPCVLLRHFGLYASKKGRWSG